MGMEIEAKGAVFLRWRITTAEGHFEFLSVPPEPVSLSVRTRGYKFSNSYPSLDWLNGGIGGLVDIDIANLSLNLVLEPGQWQFNHESRNFPFLPAPICRCFARAAL